ncbi:DUF2207 domain-containing protein [Georgenia sp. MJ173]|uniref:DUF2207 domain-containing protein n=1 Tax=Georgenia sunbinii TaxID=3117728 RepID=UPI002F26CE7A
MAPGTLPGPRATLVGALTALLLAVVVVLALPLPASADDGSVGQITRYDVTATLDADGGTARVEIDLDYDFGDDEAHGPFLVLAERQEIADDPDHYRQMAIDDITAESLTDAPGDLRVERESGAVQLYIGDEDVDVTGQHRYRVAYTVEGLVDPAVTGPDGTVRDELFWNVVSSGGFDIPLDDVSVSVTGPAASEATACFAGRSSSTTPCDSAGDPGTATDFTQGALDEGEGLSVVVGWPAGTFTGAEPVLEPRRTWANTMQLTPVTGGIAGLVTVLGAGGAIAVATRRGRDKAYLGTTPGLMPAGGEPPRVGRSRRQPVAVRFTPPDGVRPGEIGTLEDETADARDVSATLIDLAVRGYLRIEEVEPGDEGDDVEDWRLVPLRGWDGGELEAYEAGLLERVFTPDDDDDDDDDDDEAAAGARDDGSVLLSEVSGRYALAVSKTQEKLYEAVTERGWFRGNPSHVRTRWVLSGLGVLALGVALGIALVLLRAPVVLALPLLVIGLVVAFAAYAAPARTAAGTAVLAQTLGFMQYLATAEAAQIRFEEGQDIFSRYLPYAIAFDLADRWAEVFAQAAAQGSAPEPTGWYVPYTAGYAWWSAAAGFDASIGAFAGAATSAVTSAGSGGSGFSGSVGGGVGGTGGGSW